MAEFIPGGAEPRARAHFIGTAATRKPRADRPGAMPGRSKTDPTHHTPQTGCSGRQRVCVTALLYGLLVALYACAPEDELIKTSAGFPPVDIPVSAPPRYAVGDSFTYDNPGETWTVAVIEDGLVTWRSSLGTTRKTVFDPFVPPVEWTARGGGGTERLTKWGEGLFPLAGGKKITFDSSQQSGTGPATPYEWKCYSGKPRKVTVPAGAFAAYPVFCRRSDGLTEQSFYAPEVNAMLQVTKRKRPAPASTRELVEFKLAPGPRIAAKASPGLPEGWTLAAVQRPAPAPDGETPVAVASAPDIPVTPNPDAVQIPEGRAMPPSSAQEVSPPAAPAVVLPAAPPVATPKAQGSDVAAGPSIPAPPSLAPPVIAPPPSIAPAVTDVPRPNPTGPSSVPSSTASRLPTIAPPPAAISTIAPPTPEQNGDRADKPAGFGVQLASFAQKAKARDAWPHFRRTLRPLLDDAPHLVRRVNLGPSKGVFHRLIAGPFDTREQARTLCRAIRDRGESCLVKRVSG
jgi:SPOR domain